MPPTRHAARALLLATALFSSGCAVVVTEVAQKAWEDRTTEASIVTLIVQLSFVVSVLMATWWMGERFSPRKLLGLAFAVFTIVAFAGE